MAGLINPHGRHSHDIQHRVVSEHFVGNVNSQEEAAVCALDTGGVARPHLQP